MSFIATQGPKSNTSADFWQMVYENNVKLIIMVCNLVEKDRPKCHKYWSEEERIKDLKLAVNSEISIDSNIVQRKITLTNKKTNEKREVKQLHFTGWPDHGVPELSLVYDSFSLMLKEVDAVKESPVVVHCSAGVGRTGTFISIYNIHHSIQNRILKGDTEFSFNIWNTVRKMKEQRILSVENILQYKFIYSFVGVYISKIFKK